MITCLFQPKKKYRYCRLLVAFEWIPEFATHVGTGDISQSIHHRFSLPLMQVTSELTKRSRTTAFYCSEPKQADDCADTRRAIPP